MHDEELSARKVDAVTKSQAERIHELGEQLAALAGRLRAVHSEQEVKTPKDCSEVGSNFALSGNELLNTIDGMVWAREFCRITGFQDEGWALGWFCNAIMTGFDEGARRGEARLRAVQEEKPCLRKYVTCDADEGGPDTWCENCQARLRAVEAQQAERIAQWRSMADDAEASVRRLRHERLDLPADTFNYKLDEARVLRRCADDLAALLPAAGVVPASPSEVQEKKEDVARVDGA
jgi:hypothetical protein